jgi:hypothetical protein
MFGAQHVRSRVRRLAFSVRHTRSALPEDAKAGCFAKRRLRTLTAER